MLQILLSSALAKLGPVHYLVLTSMWSDLITGGQQDVYPFTPGIFMCLDCVSSDDPICEWRKDCLHIYYVSLLLHSLSDKNVPCVLVGVTCKKRKLKNQIRKKTKKLHKSFPLCCDIAVD